MSIFRKFLMGQCSKLVHTKEPYKSLGMSTKRIFDDMYLYLKEISIKSTSFRNIDKINGLPKSEDYAEVASQYWNNIYKDNALEPELKKNSNFLLQ